MQEKVYEVDIAERLKLDGVLKADPYGTVSFTRQGYKTKDGSIVGADAGKIYVYFKADDPFFAFAEAKFKEGAVASAKRAPDEAAAKVIQFIHDEDASAEQGLGAIFG